MFISLALLARDFLCYNLIMKLFYFQDNQNNFLAERNFLQSKAGINIAQADGYEVKSLAWRSEAPSSSLAKIKASTILIKKPLLGNLNYYYSPRGPLFNQIDQASLIKLFSLLAEDIKNLDQQTVFWRFEPDNYQFIEQKAKIPEFFSYWSKQKFKIVKVADVQPSKTLFLDLTLSEKELLAAMHQKTRYNIRLAQKKGVEIWEGNKNDLQKFWQLLNLTSQRDRFRIHNLQHYQNLLEKGAPEVKLLLANYKNRTIAAGLFATNRFKSTYLHGASDNQYRNVMAPYLLQWFAIKAAKNFGSRYYDFYGLDEQKWPGVSRFKLGFGGQRVVYPGTYDLIFKPNYYALYHWGRGLKRRIKII